MDHLCYLCLVFVMHSRLFIAALWSPEGKGLTSRLLFVMSIVILFCCILAVGCIYLSVFNTISMLINKEYDLTKKMYDRICDYYTVTELTWL